MSDAGSIAGQRIQRLDNFRQAYCELEQRVHRALRTQLGDVGRLTEVRTQALSLLQAATAVCIFSFL